MNIDYNTLESQDINSILSTYIVDNDIENIKKIFTDPIGRTKCNIDHFNQAFWYACQTDRINIVQYLLTSSDIEYPDIHIAMDSPFCSACEYASVDMVKYLLTSPNITTPINIHAQKDYAFISACQRKKIDTIKYFIFEKHIVKTYYINQYLNDYPNELVEQLFNVRDLNISLQIELNMNKHKNEKKVKL